MSRPKKSRKILMPPAMRGFKPYGLPTCKIESIQLTFEEYESIKLVNYEQLDQDQAAFQMNVSRPTFTRIYNKALKTIAQALVEAKAITIEGGNYQLEADWFRCRKCHKLIEGLQNHVKCEDCEMFGNNELISLKS
ncbi:MAG: DUF134 domain-containing protein [Bacteroidales bacterium]